MRLVRKFVFGYRVHGLWIDSEFDLPGTRQPLPTVDVRIRRGVVPLTLQAPVTTGVLFQAGPEGYLLRVDGVAAYLVRNANEVIVDSDPAAPQGAVQLFLCGSVMTAILHQRGALVLHASGAVGRRGAVLIAGDSGSGKSTLAAALAHRGHHIVSDDLTAVTSTEAGPVAPAGFPMLRLWQDAIHRLGEDPARYERVRSGVNKHQYHVAPNALDPSPVSAIFVLERAPGTEVSAVTVRPTDAFAQLRRHTRTPRVLEGLGSRASYFRVAADVASRVPVTLLRRPAGGDSVEALVALMTPALG